MNTKLGFKELSINMLTSRPIQRMMQPIRNQVVPIFMLHRFADTRRDINGHSVELLKQALAYLKSHGYTIVSIRQLIAALQGGLPLPPSAVAFSMDDGFYDQIQYAVPLFIEYEAPVTLFLATDMMDGDYWSWDYQLEYAIHRTCENSFSTEIDGDLLHFSLKTRELRKLCVRQLRYHLKQLSHPLAISCTFQLAKQLSVSIPDKAPEPYQPITWDQVRQYESNIVEFGPHTKTHCILSKLSEADATDEIAGSWQRLSKEVSNPVPVFCYPTGRQGLDFGDREQSIVKKLGLQGGLSADPGFVEIRNPSSRNCFALKRFSFPETLTDFKQYCSWLEKAKETLWKRSF